MSNASEQLQRPCAGTRNGDQCSTMLAAEDNRIYCSVCEDSASRFFALFGKDVYDATALEQLGRSGFPTARMTAASHSSTPVKMLSKLAQDLNPDIRLAVASNPASMSTQALKRLAGDPSRHVRLAVAKRQPLPVSVLEVLADDDCTEIIEIVARHEKLTDKIGSKLIDRAVGFESKIAKSRILEITALNPKLSPKLLGKLAEHPSPQVRKGAAQNPSTPDTALALLIQDDECEVRSSTTANAAAPLSLLHYAADNLGDLSWANVKRLAVHPKSDDEILHKIACSRYGDYVQDIILRHPSSNRRTLVKAAPKASPDAQAALMERTDLDAATVDELARSRSSNIRRLAARHPLVTPKRLRQMARHKDYETQKGLLENPSTPTEALLKLAQSTHDDIPLHMLSLGRDLDAEVLSMLACHSAAKVRRKICEQKNIAESDLVMLMMDPEDAVRDAATSAYRGKAA